MSLKTLGTSVLSRIWGMSSWAKRILVIAILLSGGYFAYAQFFKTAPVTNRITLTDTVKRGTIEDSIKTTGTANLVDEQKIRFNQLGRVASIHFKQGDTVKRGDIIAVLDTSDALNSIKQAEINLSNSKISLAETLKPAEQKDLLQAQNSINKTKSDIAAAKQSYANAQLEKANKLRDIENSITSKKASLAANAVDIENKQASYQSDLDSKKSQLELERKKLATLVEQEGKTNSNTETDTKKTLSTALTDARKQLIDAQALLRTVDEIFGITETNRSKNDAYEAYMSSDRSKVEFEWYTSNGLHQKYETLYLKVSWGENTVENVSELLAGTSELYNSLITLGADAAETIKAGLAATTYPQATIDSQYSSMQSVKSQAQSAYDSIQTARANVLKLSDPSLLEKQSQNTIEKQKLTIKDLETAIANYDRDYTAALTNLRNTGVNLKNEKASLENSLTLTTKSYDAQLAQSRANLENLESTLAVNVANYEYVKRGESNEQIQKLRNDIAKQELSLTNAKKDLEKYRIEAPFDGVLRQIDFKVGDNLVSDDTKYVYIDNPNVLEISATLDQIDVAKVQTGQEVKIIFDSFSSMTFTGSVTQINSTPISTSGVTSYTIKIAMDKKEYQIYSGMTAKLTITVSKKENVLTVPSEYIQTGSGKTTLLLQDASSPRGKRVEVVTGVSTNTSTEIVSGVEEGATVVRYVNVSSTSASNAASSTSALRAASRASSGGGTNGGGGFSGPPPGF